MSKFISFKPISPSSVDDIILSCPETWDKDELSDILESLSYMSEEVEEVAVSLLHDAVAVRVLDGGRYMFVSPLGMIDGWDIKGALERIREYAVKEMIPLIFTDTPRDTLPTYSEVFRLVSASVYEDDDDLFFVFVDNECSSLDAPPSFSLGDLTLSEMRDEDLPLYARLSRDGDLNKYWGYDASDDNTADTDEFFLETARREFNTGVAVTLGVYLSGEFIGEGVIYSFDFKGGASVALRLLPEYHGKGIGKRAFSALISLAEEIDLLEVKAEVMVENLPSIAMTSYFLDKKCEADGIIYYSKKLK